MCPQALRTRPARTPVLSACLLVILCATTSAAQSSAGTYHDKVLEILSRAAAGSDTSAEERGRELALLGQPALPVLLDVYQEAVRANNGNSSASALSLEQQLALVDAVSRFERGAIVSEVSERYRLGGGIPERIAWMHFVRRVGNAQDLELLIGIASFSKDGDSLHAPLAHDFGNAALEILRRDPPPLSKVRSSILRADRDVAESLIITYGRLRNPYALKSLVSLLGFDTLVEGVLLRTLHMLSQAVGACGDPEVLEPIRKYVDVDEPTLAIEAIRTLGYLEDGEAIGAMIARLDSEPDVALSAHWALKRITELNFTPHPKRWVVWHENESAWFERESRRVVNQLYDDHDGNVVRALNEIANHPLFRTRFIDDVEVLLDHSSWNIRRRATIALGRMHAQGSVTRLVDGLLDSDERVRKETWQALKALTGEDLPADYNTWRDFAENSKRG